MKLCLLLFAAFLSVHSTWVVKRSHFSEDDNEIKTYKSIDLFASPNENFEISFNPSIARFENYSAK